MYSCFADTKIVPPAPLFFDQSGLGTLPTARFAHKKGLETKKMQKKCFFSGKHLVHSKKGSNFAAYF